jgi:hypothetical protein
MTEQTIRSETLDQLVTETVELVRAAKSAVLEILDYVGNILKDAENVAARQGVDCDAVPIPKEFPPSLAQVLERIRHGPLG